MFVEVITAVGESKAQWQVQSPSVIDGSPQFFCNLP